MKKYLLLIFILTSCTQNKITEPILVKVPVVASCYQELIAEPDWNIPKLTKSAKPDEKLKAAISDLYLSKAYI
ncbi:MAG: hypothetical protein WCJ33_03730, partial [Pseudomonadota bacterium]